MFGEGWDAGKGQEWRVRSAWESTGRGGCVKRDHVRGLVRGVVTLVNSKL